MILSATEPDCGRSTTALFSFDKGLGVHGRQSGDHARAQGRRRPRAPDDVRQAAARPASRSPRRRRSSGRKIDPPQGRTAWIDYAGPDAHDPVRQPRRRRAQSVRPDGVRGKVVVVGATATSLQDQHNTSTTRNFLMPGPEIQANSIATALAGFPLHERGVVGQRAAGRRGRRDRAARRAALRRSSPRSPPALAALVALPGRSPARVPARGRDRHRGLPARRRASPASC